jgi:hypothetical protein
MGMLIGQFRLSEPPCSLIGIAQIIRNPWLAWGFCERILPQRHFRTIGLVPRHRGNAQTEQHHCRECNGRPAAIRDQHALLHDKAGRKEYADRREIKLAIVGDVEPRQQRIGRQ